MLLFFFFFYVLFCFFFFIGHSVGVGCNLYPFCLFPLLIHQMPASFCFHMEPIGLQHSCQQQLDFIGPQNHSCVSQKKSLATLCLFSPSWLTKCDEKARKSYRGVECVTKLACISFTQFWSCCHIQLKGKTATEFMH